MASDGQGHNSLDGGHLKAFAERIERLEEEIKANNADKAEIYAEAKSNGYDVKILKRVIAIRRQDPNKLAEEQALYDAYWSAVGGAP